MPYLRTGKGKDAADIYFEVKGELSKDVSGCADTRHAFIHVKPLFLTALITAPNPLLLVFHLCAPHGVEQRRTPWTRMTSDLALCSSWVRNLTRALPATFRLARRSACYALLRAFVY